MVEGWWYRKGCPSPYSQPTCVIGTSRLSSLEHKFNPTCLEPETVTQTCRPYVNSGSICFRRYEVQGEYVIPSSAAIPSSAVSMAMAPQAMPRAAGNVQPPLRRFEAPATGRWRLQVRKLQIFELDVQMHQKVHLCEPSL